jgi:phosphatidylserine/phosphatidylglycerophosphate/cardiolipin synthase-like enzyme
MKPFAVDRKLVARLLLITGMIAILTFAVAYRSLDRPAAIPPFPSTFGSIELLFSHPQSVSTQESGPDQAVVSSVENASCCIDIAVYDLDLLSIARALARAVHRGVAVRLVTDSDNLHGEAIAMLQGMGVPIIGDRRSALMHDKFIVIDHAHVWVGSMNLTFNDAYLNDNNFFRMDSTELAGVFENEFEEMFTRRQFGAGDPTKMIQPIRLASGCTVQAYFSPEDAPARVLLRQIQLARTSIHVLAFSFTSSEIGAALQSAFHRGVEVRGVMERTQVNSNASAQYLPLRNAGIQMRLDGNPKNMHHKVMILDGRVVVAGSYNFTASAEHNNDEDMLIFECPPIVSPFENEFQRVFSLGFS